jgi:23S rRNA-/tRNA-specific pseudouridylate synthase
MAASRGKGKGERVDDGDLFASPPDLEHDYVVLDGVRLVRPYAFDFVCHVKRRQAGLDVVEAFAREFPGRPRSYYEAAHKTGLLRVEKAAPAKNKPSGKKTGATRKRCRAEEAGEPEEATERTEPTASPTALSRKTSSDGKKNEPEIEPLRPLHAGERIRHYLHRHEPPTLSDPVTVLAATESMVAVYKPATVPVHPTGQYRKNTVLGLIAASRPDLGRLLPVHRLDKNVSGLLLMARDAASANRLREEVQSHSVRKRYVALVSSAHLATGKHILETFAAGRESESESESFAGPSLRLEKAVVDVGLRYDPRARLATCADDSEGDRSNTFSEEENGAKDARTAFALVAVSAADAFVDATFRAPEKMSRNDVKLATNENVDPLVSSSRRGFGGVRAPHRTHAPDSRALETRGAPHRQRRAVRRRSFDGRRRDAKVSGDVPRDARRRFAKRLGCRKKEEASSWPLCPHCPMMAHGANDAAEGDAGGSGARAEDLERLYLHCAEYRGATWAFACPTPSWVPEDIADAEILRFLD